MGNETNMAARLMGKANAGQVLVTKQVVERAEHHYHFRVLEPIVVKGRVEPLPVWEVRGQKQGAAREWALFTEPPVGRHETLFQLEERLVELLDGNGQVVDMTGDAGMGKSHLAAEFGRRARERGALLILGSCQSITRTTSYYPWRQIFRNLLNIENIDEEEAVAQLTVFLEEKYPDWLLRLPLLGDLLHLPIPDNPTTAGLEANVRQRSLFSLLAEIIQLSALMEPLIMVIENAHWMDEASMTLAQALAQGIVGSDQVMLCLLHRPEMAGDSPLLPELADLPYYTGIRLGEMSDDEVATLVERRLEHRPAPLLLSVVKKMALGNPLFAGELIDAMGQDGQLSPQDDGAWTLAEELLNQLRTADLLVQVDGDWRLKPDADMATVKMGIPDSIHGIILTRLDRLPEAHKLTLKVSSVIGYYFSLYLVAQAHPVEKEVAHLLSEAAEMEGEDVIREEIPEQATFAFRHHTIQEVAYETLLFTQRQNLHGLVAEGLAEMQPEAIDQIAHHAFMGEIWPLALEYNLLAGTQAKSLFANQQSIDLYQKALRSAEAMPAQESGSQRKAIHLALGELFVSTGQYDDAAGYLHKALALAQSQADHQAEARTCRWFGRSYELHGEYDEAMTWIERGLAALADIDSVEEAELSLIAGLISIRQGEYDRALQLCERSLHVADKLDQPVVRARTYNLMGIVDLRRGNIAIALDRSLQSLRQYEELGDVYGQATSHNLVANGHFVRGELSSADHHYRQSLTMFTQIGDIYNQVLVNNNLGGIARQQGRLGAALAYYQGAVRLLGQIGGSLWVFGALRMNTGNTHLQRDELKEAAEQLQQAEDYFEQAQLRDLLPELFGLKAELACRQHRLEEAETIGQQSVELARELKMPREEGHNLRVLGQVAHARAEFTLAEERLQASYIVLRGADDDYECAKTKLVLARVYAAQGQRAETLNALAICEPIFSRLEATIDLQEAQTLRLSNAKPAAS